MRSLKLVLLQLITLSFAGCHTVPYYRFATPSSFVFEIGNWQIVKLNFDWTKFHQRDKARDWEYLPEMMIEFNSQQGMNSYPFFTNDIVIDEMSFESLSDNFGIQTSPILSMGYLDGMFSEEAGIKDVKIRSLFSGVFELVRRDSISRGVDTLCIQLPSSLSKGSEVDSLKQKFNKFFALNNVDELRRYTSTGTKATKFIRFKGVKIPPAIKTIKVSFTAKIVDHFTSGVLTSKYFEEILQREDSTSTYLGQ